MKGCSKIREELSAYIDGALATDELSSVEAHLAECEACSGALADMKKVVQHLQSLEQVEPPAWFAQKVMAHVRSAGQHEGIFARLMRPLYVKIPVGAIATAILAITTYFIFQGIVTDMPVRMKAEQEAAAPAATMSSENEKGKKDLIKPRAEVRHTKESRDHLGQKKDMVATRAEDSAYTGIAKSEYSPAAPAPAPARVMEQKAVAPSAAATYEKGYQETAGMQKAKKAMAPQVYGAAQDKAVSANTEETYQPSKRGRFMMAEKVPVLFHIASADMAAAARKVADAFRQYYGRDIRTEQINGKVIVKAEVSVSWLEPLYARLKVIGEIKESAAPMFADVSTVLVTVEIREE